MRTFTQAACLSLSLALGAGAFQTVMAQQIQPELGPAQQAFIDDPANLKPFGLTKEKLAKVLQGRDAATIATTLSAMMETIEAAKYRGYDGPQPEGQSKLDPVGDMPEIALNPQAGQFNRGLVLRPSILDQYQRDPGPFSLKRYMYETDGIPTFANAPVALRAEDLVAGEVDVAFVGVPLNMGSGWRDSHNAPRTLRAMYGIGGFDVYAGVDPSLELSLADYGNISVDRLSIELGVTHVREMVGGMVEAGVIPFIIGGDHSVMFPTVAAMADQFGAKNVGVVHLDAHYNAARDLAHFQSDTQVVSRLIQDGLIEGKNLVQVGLRGPEMDEEALEWMRSQGLRYHTMAEVEAKGWDKVMRAAIDEAKDGPENIFISFDISVLDPAYARGAGRPVAGGLTMREAMPLVRRLCAETKVVGFELLDVSPFLDLSYATSLNANAILHSCLTGVAMRKKGLDKKAYLSPLTVSD